MKHLFSIILGLLSFCQLQAQSWTADNGNRTFTNPLFYDEFTDPDLIRVGTDFYMVASSMHAMPGLPLLRSKDLVNWEFVTYIFDRLDLGPDFHLEGDKGIYGNGIWAPAIRYHKGTFYVFVNVNDHGLQVFSAKDPAGPWIHKNMGGRIYDLGILFDDDDKIYAVHGYDEVRLIQLKPDFSGYVEGSEKVIIPKGNAMGEGHHFYKINGKYYIISADYAPVGRMQCARADKPEGPYETAVISNRETMGTQRGWWSNEFGFWSNIPNEGDKITFTAPNPDAYYAVPLHQGGIVDLPNGEWWGVSMMDVKSVGRLTFLSPVTWKNGWPFFGIENNLGRSPRTWFKPNVGIETTPHTTYERNDDFSGKELKPIWQWNHYPVEKKWTLKNGTLRLHTMPAKSFMHAKNSLTQRAVGPESNAIVELNTKSLKKGDVAGLAIVIGMVGLGMTKAGALEFLSGSSSETLIVRIASLIAQHGVLAAVLAGLILAGILAATMSTADSQMLAAASSVSQNILQEFGHMKLTEKQSLFAARLTIICVSVVGVVLARDPNSSVFGIVSFAWAGFGGCLRRRGALRPVLEALQLAGRAGRDALRRPDGLRLEVPHQPAGRRVRHL